MKFNIPSHINYNIIALFFLLLQILVYIGIIPSNNDYDLFFWYCNHIPLFFAIFFFFKKTQTIKGLINVGFLIQLLWSIDFIIALFTNFYIFNITRYVFEDLVGIGKFIPIFVHIISTNIALILTYKKKTKNISLIYSFIYVVILYVATIIFTNPQKNINCIQEVCALNIDFFGYTQLWIFIIFIILVIPTHFIQKKLNKIYKQS